jgi:hypothetical protein
VVLEISLMGRRSSPPSNGSAALRVGPRLLIFVVVLLLPPPPHGPVMKTQPRGATRLGHNPKHGWHTGDLVVRHHGLRVPSAGIQTNWVKETVPLQNPRVCGDRNRWWWWCKGRTTVATTTTAAVVWINDSV